MPVPALLGASMRFVDSGALNGIPAGIDVLSFATDHAGLSKECDVRRYFYGA